MRKETAGCFGKDYHGKKYFDDSIECLDMDKYEETECAGDKKKL